MGRGWLYSCRTRHRSGGLARRLGGRPRRLPPEVAAHSVPWRRSSGLAAPGAEVGPLLDIHADGGQGIGQPRSVSGGGTRPPIAASVSSLSTNSRSMAPGSEMGARLPDRRPRCIWCVDRWQAAGAAGRVDPRERSSSDARGGRTLGAAGPAWRSPSADKAFESRCLPPVARQLAGASNVADPSTARPQESAVKRLETVEWQRRNALGPAAPAACGRPRWSRARSASAPLPAGDRREACATGLRWGAARAVLWFNHHAPTACGIAGTPWAAGGPPARPAPVAPSHRGRSAQPDCRASVPPPPPANDGRPISRCIGLQQPSSFLATPPRS